MIDRLDDLVCEEEEEEEEEDEEYEQHDDEASDSEDDSETEASDEDEWGFGKKKSRFSKQVILGFAAIVLISSIFGAVVMKNLGNDGDEVAEGPGTGDLGEEGGPVDPNDPFGTGEGVRTAAHSDSGEPGSGEGTGESGESAFTSGETGSEMGSFGEGETGSGLAELQTEPAIDDGTGGTRPRLDPFGQPLGSTDGTGSGTSTGIGATGTGTGVTGIGETPGFGPTAGVSSGAGFGSTDVGEPGFGENRFGGSGSETTRPFGPETESTLGPERSTGLFGSTGESGTGTGSTGEIRPFADRPDRFGRTETDRRVDEFGRPVDEYGRPIDGGSTGRTAIAEDSRPFGESGTGIGESGTGSLSGSGIGESTTGFGPAATGIGTGTSRPGESTTSLFPDESTGSERRAGDEPTGLFDSGNSGSGISEPAFGETPSETPGFGSGTGTGTAEERYPFGDRDSSTGDTGSSGTGSTGTGALPRESLFPSDSGSSETSPETGSSGISSGSGFGSSGTDFGSSERGTGLGTRESLPVIRSQDPGSFGSTSSTVIVGSYPVKTGDSYWTISRKVYGTARYFRVLAEYNSKAIPNSARLRPGMIIKTPAEAVMRQMLLANSSASAGTAAARRPTGSPPVTPQQGVFFDEKNQPRYRVGKNDTLTTIAAEHLGRWARWRQIYEMNRDQLNNPNKLQIGMVLKLPPDATRSAMSGRAAGIR